MNKVVSIPFENLRIVESVVQIIAEEFKVGWAVDLYRINVDCCDLQLWSQLNRGNKNEECKAPSAQ